MSKNIVQTCKPYAYQHLECDIKRLKRQYPFIHIEVIGHSVLGKGIYAIRLGQGEKELFYSGDWHANEYLTGHLLMKFIEDYSQSFKNSQSILRYNIEYLFQEYSIWIAPMVNPDGIDLVIHGLEQNNPYYEWILSINQNNLDFQNWTANARGVDLNHQWPAKWEEEVKRSPQFPSPKRYGGEMPLSEPETKSIYNFVRRHDFEMVLAFHSQGKEIFGDSKV
ncbi:M14 family zinc carboxypeptidase [Tepidibacillus marianensis]|uniref:M14 family zinc carboxypeptidase n=1 Tax=Tepidibacillus marianensis TaxID=3131995 RepID=UPI0030D2AFD9